MTRHYGVMGLGLTGWSCVRYLKQQGARVSVLDTRSQPPFLKALQRTYPDVFYQVGVAFNSDLVSELTDIVVSPGLCLSTPFFEAARRQQKPIYGDIELFMRAVKEPVIGITGTNGKSTVTALVGALLEEAGYEARVGGNIGLPALDLLALEPSGARLGCYYVLELSSYQLDTSLSLPLISAALLNLTPDHLDRYGTMEAYRRSKCRIWREAKRLIYNREKPVEGLPERGVDRLSFGLTVPDKVGDYGLCLVQEETWFAKGTQPIAPVTELFLLGRHNQANALAALALVDHLSIPFATLRHTLQHFPGLPHRCQKVAYDRGVLWINDSKGTNVEAVLTALEALRSQYAQKLIILLGGAPKSESYEPLVAALRGMAKGVIVMGGAIRLLLPLLAQYADEFYLGQAPESMSQAIELAGEIAQEGDCVLLSPACPSYDWYQNFEERGTDFIQQLTSYRRQEQA